ncbi:MAG: acyl carrier protein [Bacillota bacterium]|nr:acyl carrier protein [Bacillota bacterium]
MDNSVRDKVVKLIAEQAGVAEDSLSDNTCLQADLELDSLDIMDLLLVLEEEFDMQIPDEELSKIQTIGDVVSYIERA